MQVRSATSAPGVAATSLRDRQRLPGQLGLVDLEVADLEQPRVGGAPRRRPRHHDHVADRAARPPGTSSTSPVGLPVRGDVLLEQQRLQRGLRAQPLEAADQRVADGHAADQDRVGGLAQHGGRGGTGAEHRGERVGQLGGDRARRSRAGTARPTRERGAPARTGAASRLRRAPRRSGQVRDPAQHVVGVERVPRACAPTAAGSGAGPARTAAHAPSSHGRRRSPTCRAPSPCAARAAALPTAASSPPSTLPVSARLDRPPAHRAGDGGGRDEPAGVGQAGPGDQVGAPRGRAARPGATDVGGHRRRRPARAAPGPSRPRTRPEHPVPLGLHAAARSPAAARPRVGDLVGEPRRSPRSRRARSAPAGARPRRPRQQRLGVRVELVGDDDRADPLAGRVAAACGPQPPGASGSAPAGPSRRRPRAVRRRRRRHSDRASSRATPPSTRATASQPVGLRGRSGRLQHHRRPGAQRSRRPRRRRRRGPAGGRPSRPSAARRAGTAAGRAAAANASRPCTAAFGRQRLEQVRRPAGRRERQRQQPERGAQRRRAEPAAVALDRAVAAAGAGRSPGGSSGPDARLDARPAQLGLAAPPHLAPRPHLPAPAAAAAAALSAGTVGLWVSACSSALAPVKARSVPMGRSARRAPS